jgi:tRNA U34 5-methylaminomethyl-2-thiouridine-forming methyltransferase MnmC
MNKLIITEDGSHSVVSEKFGVTYHSRHGAMTESIVVFIKPGLEHALEKFKTEELKILEMGLGTGLNAYLSCVTAEEKNRNIHYTSVEAYPLEEDLWRQLNYPEIIGIDTRHILYSIHEVPEGETHQISPKMKLLKLEKEIEQLDLNDQYDLIYHDGFAPSSQPQLWEGEIVKKLYDALKPGGIMVTYCAKGSFKRCLKEQGLMLEELPGPPGKREMTRAVKALQ